jgi:CheY-like chemotaxis protein
MDSFSPHILVVTASPTLRFTLGELLRHYGYTVTTAARSEVADLLAHGPFDVVLLADALPTITETADTPLVQAQPQPLLERALAAE